jgi:DNA-binding Lrp family transcriptional regulator
MLTDLEKKIVAAIQEDIAITERPYLEIARSLDISEETLLDHLRGLCTRGIIRRFGATLRHQQTGYKANAMAAWKVDESRIDEVGKAMAARPQVSHCYRRNPTGQWRYNLYTMIHAANEADCRETARQMAQSAAVEEYALLFSREELKKTSMVYFATDDED